MERSTVYRRKADFDSCFSGFFRLFDPAGLMNHQYRNTNVFNKSNGLSKDRELMASDWGIVGGELKNSIKKLESEIHG